MAQSVFSTRFLAQAGLAGTGVSVLVPAGHVYIVKQVTMYASPSIGPIRMFLEDDTTGAALFSAATQAGTPGWFGLYGALVFEPGQGFHFQIDAFPTDAADVYCGGYDLLLP
jgi:hypothetical protein